MGPALPNALSRSRWRAPRLSRQVPMQPDSVLGGVVLLAPLAIGGVVLEAKVALSATALGLAVWVAARRRARGVPLRMGMAGLGLLALVVWTFLQWMPLPPALVAALSPESVALRDASAALLGLDPQGWPSLSLDRARTADALVGLVGAFAVFVSAANVGNTLDDRRRIGVWIVVAALATLAVGVGHELVGASRIYGLYTPRADVSELPMLSSFVNPNHAAALMVLGALTALGLAYPVGQRLPNGWFLVAWMVLAVGIVATLSRANTVLFVGAMAVMTPYLMVYWKGTHTVARTLRIVIGTLAVIGAAIVVLGPRRWLEEMATIADLEAHRDGVIASCWALGLDVATANWGVGVGHGAFQIAATQQMPHWQTGLVSFAHNGVLQAVADWGLPMATLGLGLVIGGLASTLRRALARPLWTALWVALAAVAIQNMGDFSLALPGVGFPAAAIAGWLVGDTARPDSLTAKRRRRDRRLRRRPAAPPGEGAGSEPSTDRRTPRIAFGMPWPLPASVLLVAMSSLVAWDALAHTPARWDDAVNHAKDRGQLSRFAVAPMVMAHPGDFHVVLLAVAVADRTGQAELARGLADRAVALAPTETGARLTRAALAARAGDSVTALEDLDVVAAAPPAGHNLAVDAALSMRSVDGLLEAFLAKDADRAVQAAGRLSRLGERKAARDLMRWAVTAFPEEATLHALHAELTQAVAARLPNGVERDAALEALNALAVDLLARGTKAEPAEAGITLKRSGYMLQAWLHEGRGETLEALHLYLAAADLMPEAAAGPLKDVGRLYLALDRAEELQRLMPRLETAAEGHRHVRGHVELLRSHLAERDGQASEAIRRMQKALRYCGDDPSFRDRLAALLDAQGDDLGAEAERARARTLRAASALTRAGKAP